jgi:hypothetical protein
MTFIEPAENFDAIAPGQSLQRWLYSQPMITLSHHHPHHNYPTHPLVLA